MKIFRVKSTNWMGIGAGADFGCAGNKIDVSPGDLVLLLTKMDVEHHYYAARGRVVLEISPQRLMHFNVLESERC